MNKTAQPACSLPWNPVRNRQHPLHDNEGAGAGRDEEHQSSGKRSGWGRDNDSSRAGIGGRSSSCHRSGVPQQHPEPLQALRTALLAPGLLQGTCATFACARGWVPPPRAWQKSSSCFLLKLPGSKKAAWEQRAEHPDTQGHPGGTALFPCPVHGPVPAQNKPWRDHHQLLENSQRGSLQCGSGPRACRHHVTPLPKACCPQDTARAGREAPSQQKDVGTLSLPRPRQEQGSSSPALPAQSSLAGTGGEGASPSPQGQPGHTLQQQELVIFQVGIRFFPR